MLTNIPRKLDPLSCKLLASVVRNFCRSVVAVLDVPEDPSEAPIAVKRF